MTQIFPPTRQIIPNNIFFNESPELIITHKGNSYRLRAPVRGDLCMFESGACLIALTINRRLGAVALDVFIGKEQQPVDGVFLQEESLIELIGDWRRLPLPTLVDRLLQLFV